MKKVIAVIGARLNSSRLPGKHLLDLAGKPLIGRIFQRLEQVPEINRIVLATTADSCNQPLVDWARSNDKDVFAYEGDVNDLTGRMDAVMTLHDPDALVYVCGDSPLIEPRTLSRLIQALFREEAEAAYVNAVDGKASIHEGFDVYAADLWRKLVQLSQASHEREHVGSVLRPLFDQLHKALVVDDPVYYRRHHRLSVDTPSDYQFMVEVYRRWYATHPPDEIVSLPQIISWLDQDKDLESMNLDVRQKSPTDQSLSVLLVTAQGPNIGLGHLARTIPCARALQDAVSAGVKLLIHGPELDRPDLHLLPHSFTPDLGVGLEQAVREKNPDVVVADLHHSLVTPELKEALARLTEDGVKLVSLDFTLPENLVHLNWVPSFYMRPGAREPEKHRHGWDCFLLDRLPPAGKTEGPPTVVALSGGSDTYGLGAQLPPLLDAQLPEEATIIWIQGPYAPTPAIPEHPRLNWRLLHNPPHMAQILTECTHALTVYGVSFFECLASGLVTAVITPDQDPAEMEALDASGVAQRFVHPQEAVSGLAVMMTENHDAMGRRARELLDGGGPTRLALALRELAGIQS